MPLLNAIELRRAISLQANANQKILMRNTYTKNRITFTGRDAGTVVVKVKMFCVGDDNQNTKVSDYRDGDFENIVNGTIDLSQRKTIIINGELSAIWIVDQGSSDYKVDIHQTNN